MEKFQKAVKEFMRAGDQGTPSRPAFPDAETVHLRRLLIGEEFEEFKRANSILDVADAIGDLLYVVIGAAVAYGIDLEPVFDEIHRSNMTKVIDGKLLKNDSGKIIKPDTYEKPNLTKVLLKQCQTKNS